jgi:hypothetical protein
VLIYDLWFSFFILKMLRDKMDFRVLARKGSWKRVWMGWMV